jgi:hypothetical protein
MVIPSNLDLNFKDKKNINIFESLGKSWYELTISTTTTDAHIISG